jgi:hypothetical protein
LLVEVQDRDIVVSRPASRHSMPQNGRERDS